MNYKIRKIEIPLETGKIIEFEAKTLCKIIEAIPDYNRVYNKDLQECYDNHEEPTFVNCRVSLDLVVMERWGDICFGYTIPDKTHRVVILKEGEEFSYTPNYEPILSRRGKFHVGTQDYYLFQV